MFEVILGIDLVSPDSVMTDLVSDPWGVESFAPLSFDPLSFDFEPQVLRMPDPPLPPPDPPQDPGEGKGSWAESWLFLTLLTLGIGVIGGWVYLDAKKSIPTGVECRS